MARRRVSMGLLTPSLENVVSWTARCSPRFPARILLKEELLPLRQDNGHIEVATSRLFSEPGLDILKSFTTSRV